MSPRRSPGAVRRALAPAGGGRVGPTSGRRRALGQHFLRDPAVADRIVSLVAPTTRDVVVEIGPGDGALTALLAGTGARLVAVEVDRALAALLRERFAGVARVEVVEADARRFDYRALRDLRPDPGGRALAVGNLPYSVGTAILQALVAAGPGIDEMALMLQKEVAARVAAPPGGKSYGSLSLLVQMACDVRLAFSVGPGAFRPPPLVDSAVVHLRALAAPRVPPGAAAGFERLVRAAFSRRRKTLANAVAGGLGLPPERARDLIASAGIDPGRRAETLSLAEFAELAARFVPGGGRGGDNPS
ncbi:MAG TPA: 16S rRNA (adenine(1518)-N(6)/adenine(1519)-N(6))-dimethyltransferase RsmA [Candidatus Binatia bacterium]|nr:16S rRNA (adenine(1518)-N(6)/adenine(1519)-N(6))-dimethyltransferase RsmA [Candidatus Binatia bacterium]